MNFVRIRIISIAVTFFNISPIKNDLIDLGYGKLNTIIGETHYFEVLLYLAELQGVHSQAFFPSKL